MPESGGPPWASETVGKVRVGTASFVIGRFIYHMRLGFAVVGVAERAAIYASTVKPCLVTNRRPPSYLPVISGLGEFVLDRHRTRREPMAGQPEKHEENGRGALGRILPEAPTLAGRRRSSEVSQDFHGIDLSKTWLALMLFA